MASRGGFGGLACAVLLAVVLHSAPAAAFGAGNIASISAIEGQNWRHGDIEDTLLQLVLAQVAGGRRFSKMEVKRVYFGNWLRDYSQAVDVGAVKYVSAEAVRLLLWVLGFMSFGFGTGAFEVTRDRLGCYRPEEHIDNPKDYADNEDARRYDPRLRAPVDERRELAIDTRTGLKHYIATEDVGIVTSAALVRDTYGRCVALGRRYAQTRDERDLFEAFRLLGTANHCLEDYAAHSNYVELCLRELGEPEVFAFVGRAALVELPGVREPVYPVVTGTFGGVDFLHSVMGEFSDKATQSELQDLEGAAQNSARGGGDFSMLQDLLGKIPSGIFGGTDHAAKASELQMNAQAAQMQNMNVSPRQPEAWARWLDGASRQIYPVLEWHDEIMLSLTEMIEQIPVLPDLIEQLTEQLNVFVFSLLAPFVLPVIEQVKTELAAGSAEVINSSRDKQLNVFYDDACTDPTHSMLSKDHFSNVLNEPAGKVSSAVLRWVVPQIMACWDDPRIDPARTLDRIVHGVFHHPAQRSHGEDGAADCRRIMFQVVEEWWATKPPQELDGLRRALGAEGVQQGWNHKEGVVDSGHGCGKPLAMPTMGTAGSSGAIGGLAAGVLGGGVLGEIGSALAGASRFDGGGGSGGGGGGGYQQGSGGGGFGGFAAGAAGGAVAGVAGVAALAAGADLLEGAFGGGSGRSSRSSGRRDLGYGQQREVFAEAEYERGGGDYEQRTTYESERFGSGGDVVRDEQVYERTEGFGGGGGGFRQQDEVVYEERDVYEQRGGGGFQQQEVYEERDVYEQRGGGGGFQQQEEVVYEQRGGGGGFQQQQEEVYEERDVYEQRGGGGGFQQQQEEVVYEERDVYQQGGGGGGYEREEVVTEEYREESFGGGGGGGCEYVEQEEVYEERDYED